jgi:hypothetical protein
VKITSSVNAGVAKLLSDVNSRIEFNRKPPASKTTEAALSLDKEIDTDIAQLSYILVYVNVYFSPQATEKVRQLRIADSKIDPATATQFITADADLYKLGVELAHILASETRESLSRVTR